jgi:hypothetical protein
MRCRITWMHPSYRDLVIDELVTQDHLRIKFLKEMSLQGIKLAISDAGGAEGTRRFPLMTDSKSWKLLRTRSIEMIGELTCREASDLLMALASATQEAVGYPEHSQLATTLAAACTTVRSKWDSSSEVLQASELETYCQASLLLKPLPPVPNLEESWTADYSRFQETLTDALNGSSLDEYAVRAWTKLTDTIHDNEPRFLRQVNFPENYSDEVSQLMEIIREDMNLDVESLSYDELASEKDRFETLRECTKILEDLTLTYQGDLEDLRADLDSFLSRMESRASDLEPPDSDDYDDDDRGQEAEFDIDALFSNL